MLGLSGTLSCALFVYLCICICVFVYETLGNIRFDILGPRSFRKYMVIMLDVTMLDVGEISFQAQTNPN